jgi:DNA-binding NtrC family response regulator
VFGAAVNNPQRHGGEPAATNDPSRVYPPPHLADAWKDILIVDDEVDLREIFDGILEKEGYIVDLAGTVAEAKGLLAAHQYRMVLVDWRLPDGDGTVIANLAAEVGSYAFVMSGYLREMLPGNVDPRQTIMKPIRPAELLAMVHACIGAAPHP